MTRIAATWAFLEFVDAAAADAAEAEVVSRTAARDPPPTRAGGQDDGSYTNSLKLYCTQLSLYLRIPRIPTTPYMTDDGTC